MTGRLGEKDGRPVSSPIKVQCPAKVNLFLEVTGRRRDGYHTLATLFAKINLFDELELRSAPAGIELEIDNPAGPPLSSGPENLVCRAVRAFREEFGVRFGVRALLRKNIPVGAGLGGGSSDAAGTLLGLARLFNLERGSPGPRLRARLRRVAAGLGADVPFFLHPEPFCVGRGVGDRLRPLAVPKALPWMVLIYPGVAVSTAEAYRGLARPSREAVLTRLAQLGTLEKKLGGGRGVSEWSGLMFNRLEDAVLPLRPEVRQAKRILLQYGAEGVLMSGSGSSVFGFMGTLEEAQRVRERFRGYPWRVLATCCLG